MALYAHEINELANCFNGKIIEMHDFGWNDSCALVGFPEKQLAEGYQKEVLRLKSCRGVIQPYSSGDFSGYVLSTFLK